MFDGLLDQEMAKDGVRRVPRLNRSEACFLGIFSFLDLDAIKKEALLAHCGYDVMPKKSFQLPTVNTSLGVVRKEKETWFAAAGRQN